MPINKKTNLWEGPSKSEDYLLGKSYVPQITPMMANSVSQVRKEMLAQELRLGLYREGSGPAKSEQGLTVMGNITGFAGKTSNAQMMHGGAGGGFRGGMGDTVMQAPEIYSPLWLMSNMSLPRDRATINAWLRSFFALNPFVHNAICLHSTYPISKLSIKCPNKKVENFFNEMIEEIDLMNVCVQIAQEYWLLGEAFVWADLDEQAGKWSRLMIYNPDYMVVNRTVIADEPNISLRPDENLKRIITSNKPSDIAQRKQLDPYIIDSVRRGKNIPLSNYHVSHLARKISPYEIRGTGLPVCIFKQLVLLDKFRECYDEETEVLTDQGFKKIFDLVELTDNEQNEETKGLLFDQNGEIASTMEVKNDFKVACFNPENEEIEFHAPQSTTISHYDGEMLHFKGKKIDVKITPNHNMWAKEQKNGRYGDFLKIPASKIADKKKFWKFKTQAKFTSGTDLSEVDVCGKKIPVELFLKVLGYLVSEGCIYENFKNGRYDALITAYQLTSSDCFEDMRDCFGKFASLLERQANHKIFMSGEGFSEGKPKEKWECKLYGKDLSGFFKSEIGVNGSTLSAQKHIPRWVLNLKPELLEILLEALVKGDGSERLSRFGTNSKGFSYSTISKQLADDVYEIVYKCGFTPNVIENAREIDGRTLVEHIITWSNTQYGVEPIVYTGHRSQINNGGGARVSKEHYDGVVWCFTVPTGLFITRRKGKITIQGNCDYTQADTMVNPLTLMKVGSAGVDGFKPTAADLEAYRMMLEDAENNKSFKMITHDAVSIEKIGSGAAIYDTMPKVQQLVKEIMVGLQVPSVIMDGADITYNNGSVALQALRDRYLVFRQMMSNWLRKKIFAPISKFNGFYDTIDGKNHLIVPEVDWNHMSLFDTADYISQLVQLSTGEGDQKRVSLHTLYRSMGLEYEDEIRKMRKETIQNVIATKEKTALDMMDLNTLRSLDDDSEIKEKEETPGEGEGSQGGGEEGGGNPLEGLPGLDTGPSAPPTPGPSEKSAPPEPPKPPAPPSPPKA